MATAQGYIFVQLYKYAEWIDLLWWLQIVELHKSPYIFLFQKVNWNSNIEMNKLIHWSSVFKLAPFDILNNSPVELVLFLQRKALKPDRNKRLEFFSSFPVKSVPKLPIYI